MNTTVSYPEDKDQLQQHSLNFTKSEILLILESLLFSSSVNIGADWVEEDFLSMISLAKKIKNSTDNKVKLSNLILYREENYEDAWTEDLREEFNNNIQQEIELSKV